MVKRVFITSDLGKYALPQWASWVKAVIDGALRVRFGNQYHPHLLFYSRRLAFECFPRDTTIQWIYETVERNHHQTFNSTI